MSVFRKINTSFWQDPFVLDLTPEEKYFYLYLMTNTKTSQCGIYEIPRKIIEIETGYNRETVEKLINRFVEYGKVIYSKLTDEIMLTNWIKYNGSSSPKVLTRVETELKDVKNKELVKKYIELSNGYKYKLDTVSILYQYSIDTQSQEEEEEEEEEEGNNDGNFSKIVQAFENNGFGTINFTTKEMLVDLIETYSSEWTLEAIEIAVESNKRNLGYVRGILKKWQSEGKNTDKSKKVDDPYAGVEVY